MGGWHSNLSAGFISYPVQPTGVFAGQTYYNSTSNLAYIYNGSSWVLLSGTIGGLIYQGTWNASTNTPTLGNGGAGGVKGDYYVVSVAGSTSIDGITDWNIGDWIVNNGTVWEQVDNTEASLSETLAIGNTTGGTDISMTSGDTLNWNVGSGGILNSASTTSPQTWDLPDASGTIALTSQIPSVAISNDIIPRGNAGGTGIEDGTWENVGNDIYPTTTGSNIGDATHRIGTIFMSSTFDYASNLLFSSGGTKMTLTTGGSLGIGATPVASALFQLDSTTQGLLSPRMTLAQKNAIVTPATGLLVYQTDGTDGFYYYDGAVWVFSDPTTPNTIYSADDTIGSGRIATLTDTLTFASSQGVSFIAPLTTDSVLHIDALTSTNDSYIAFENGGAQKYAFGYDGTLDRLKLMTTAFTGGSFTIFSADTTRLWTNNTINVGIGTVPSATKFLVRGNGTGTDENVLFEDSTGVNRFLQWDNGQLFTASGGLVVTSATFGQYHRSTNFATGFAFYGSNNSNYAMNIQGIGGTAIALNVGHQNSPTGITQGISSDAFSTGGSNNYGVHGLGRNGTSRAIGVYGETGGGATISSSSYVAGVYGHAHCNLGGVDMIGGRFQAGQDNSAIVYTNVDMIAVYGDALGSTNGSSSGVNSIGGRFSASNGNTNIAILVPSTGNSGTVVFGANTVSANLSMLEVTGDIELITIGDGLILKSPDGQRWKFTPLNTGAWTSVTV